MSYRFFSNSSCILSVTSLEKFDAPFASSCAINPQHTQIANVNAQLLDRSTPATRSESYERIERRDEPESITSGDQDSQAVLNEPETDFGEISALAHAVHTNKRDAIRHALLSRR